MNLSEIRENGKFLDPEEEIPDQNTYHPGKKSPTFKRTPT